MPKCSVTYVLGFSGLCGGGKVVCHHTAGLRRRGWDAQVWSVAPPPGWFDGDTGWRTFPSTNALGAALRERTGVKVGTYVPHWSWVWDNLLPGDTGYGLLQDFDWETYSGNPHMDAAAVKRLRVITEGVWVTEEVQRRHGVTAVNVGIGVESVFRPLPMIRERFRVFAPARTTSAGRTDLKGWDVIQQAVRLAADRVVGMSLVTFGIESIPHLMWIPHVHVRNPNDRHLRELYCQAGVFLSASRHEGFGLPMLEAMACGAPVVCTDAHGNREFCRDGATCLMAPSEDAAGLADRLVRMLTDEPLAKRHGEAGRQESKRYRWDAVLDRLEALYSDAPGGV